jgi:hypothetical protein
MGVRRVGCVLALLVLSAAGARAQANPAFDAAIWTPIGCDASPLTANAPSRGELDLVGDSTFPAAYVAQDGTYFYMRLRVADDPRNSLRGFLGSADWAMIVQVPAGDARQYQYQFTLNGDAPNGNDTVEIWRNDTADDITFNPLFTDTPETKIWSQVFDATGVNTTPIARAVQTGDGSTFRNRPNWFVDVALPLSVLTDNGVVSNPTDMSRALFFPVTATSPEKHNRDWLSCPFVPTSTLTVSESVAPTSVTSNVATPVTFTIEVQASDRARGIELTQPALPATLFTVTGVDVSADDPGVTWTTVTQDPLDILVPELPAGATLKVQLHASARFGCSDSPVTTGATATGINVVDPASATAVLGNDMTAGTEVCDGLDNDCNGTIDDGGNTLCDDGNPCNGLETCGGTAGCQQGTPMDCDDHNGCTADTCDASIGCVHTPLPGCTPCQSPTDCDDQNPCTNDVCASGACQNQVISGCVPCTDVSQCNDSDPCTDDACPAGACTHTSRPGCIRCTSAGQCDDQNMCTTDSCDAEICTNTPIPGCVICNPTPEICNDGVDNDCDGLVDCADPDCAAAANCQPPPVEICGNCIDDDGNGLTDAEDPACCANPLTLGVAHLMLRSNDTRTHGNRLKLDAQYAPFAPPLFDPLVQDTQVELSDNGQPVLCTIVGGAHWKRASRLVFRFADRGGHFAGGLDSGQFRIDRSGRVLFSARSRSVGMSGLQTGNVRITIRVGNQCSSSSLALRPDRKGLVFP